MRQPLLKLLRIRLGICMILAVHVRADYRAISKPLHRHFSTHLGRKLTEFSAQSIGAFYADRTSKWYDPHNRSRFRCKRCKCRKACQRWIKFSDYQTAAVNVCTHISSRLTKFRRNLYKRLILTALWSCAWNSKSVKFQVEKFKSPKFWRACQRSIKSCD